MPSEYQGQCSQCGHRGPILAWGYQAIVLGDTQIVELPHPREAAALREHGLSFFRAGIRGRYARVDHRVCLDCGAQGERAVLGFPFTVMGCLLVAFVLSALALGGALAGIPTWILPLLGIGGWLVLTWSSGRLVRVVFRKRQQGLPAGARCPECGGARMRDVASALQHQLPCPACGQRSFRLYAVDLLPSRS